MVAKYGPVIKHVVGDKVSFKKVKKDIDLEKLKGVSTLEEIVDNNDFKGRLLGEYKDERFILNVGSLDCL